MRDTEQKQSASKAYILQNIQEVAGSLKSSSKDPQAEDRFIQKVGTFSGRFQLGHLLKAFYFLASALRLVDFCLTHKVTEGLIRTAYRHVVQSAGQLLNKISKQLQTVDEAVFVEFEGLFKLAVIDFMRLKGHDIPDEDLTPAQEPNPVTEPNCAPAANLDAPPSAELGSKERPIEISAYLKPTKLQVIDEPADGINLDKGSLITKIKKGSPVALIGFVPEPGVDIDHDDEMADFSKAEKWVEGSTKLCQTHGKWIRITLDQTAYDHDTYSTWEEMAGALNQAYKADLRSAKKASK